MKATFPLERSNLEIREEDKELIWETKAGKEREVSVEESIMAGKEGRGLEKREKT